MSQELPVVTAEGTVWISHHMFYLADDRRLPEFSQLPTNGLIVVEPGVAVLSTGVHTGAVRAMVEVRRETPVAVDTVAWDEVVEVSLEAVTGRVRVSTVMDHRPDLPVLTPGGRGQYRVRVHARGRDIEPDGVASDPVEDYLIVVWPAGPGPEVVFRQTDEVGAQLRRAAAGREPVRIAPEQLDPHARLRQEALRRGLAQFRNRSQLEWDADERR